MTATNDANGLRSAPPKGTGLAPNRCPYCSAPITDEQRARIEAQRVAEAPCTCPIGFGTTRNPNCPRHGNRNPAHTITGPGLWSRAGAQFAPATEQPAQQDDMPVRQLTAEDYG